MAEHENGQERTEQPTLKRQQDARKKGQVPRSRELSTLLTLLAGAATLIFLGAHLIAGLTNMFTNLLVLEPTKDMNPMTLSLILSQSLGQALWLLTPLFIVLMVSAFAGPAALGGLTFSTSALAFKLEKIDPLKGMKRIFSAKSLMELVKAVAKFALVATVATLVIWLMFDQLHSLGHTQVGVSLTRLGDMVGTAMLSLCLALLLIAAMDVPFQLWDHNRQMRMTRQEIKDELKETEGRPEVKSRVRELQRERSRQRMFEELPSASVVITNPTHFAVALRYDSDGARAPVLVAKGRGLVAARIRDVASEHNIAIVSAPTLARAIYANTELGQEIPEQLYLAVAQVLAYVYQLEQALKPGQPRPKPPRNLPVPETMIRDFA